MSEIPPSVREVIEKQKIELSEIDGDGDESTEELIEAVIEKLEEMDENTEATQEMLLILTGLDG